MIFIFLINKVSVNQFQLTKAANRMGTIGIKVDPDKVKGIVFSNEPDAPSLNRATR